MKGGGMPLTFGEAFDGARDGQYRVQANLVITQGDGRTAVSETTTQFSPGLLTVPTGGARVLTNISSLPFEAMRVRFSDRTANDGSQLGWLPFTGSADRVGLEISDQGGNSYSAQLRLYSWGGISYTVQMSQANQAKLLLGWGDTIGFGEPQALYVISFTQLIAWIK
jgi:hypothetical protein